MAPLDAQIEAWFEHPPQHHARTPRAIVFAAALAAGLAVGATAAVKLSPPPAKSKPSVMRLEPLYVTAPREPKEVLVSAAASAAP